MKILMYSFLNHHNAASMCIGIELSIREWATSQRPHPKKTDSLYCNSHKLPIALQPGSELCEPNPHTWWNFGRLDFCVGLVQAFCMQIKAPVSPCVQWPCHIWVILFFIHLPLPLALIVFHLFG